MAVSKISAEDLLAKMLQKPLLIIDVRQQDDHGASSAKIPGAFRVEPGDGASLDELLAGRDKAKPVVVYCSGPEDSLSIDEAQVLSDKGFSRLYVLQGGFSAWEQAQYPLELK